MRALLVIAVLGMFACSSETSQYESSKESESNLFGIGSSYKSSGASKSSSDSSNYQSSGSGSWFGGWFGNSSAYPASGSSSYPSSGASDDTSDDGSGDDSASNLAPAGSLGYGDKCSDDSECSSGTCAPDDDGVTFCSN